DYYCSSYAGSNTWVF
nr:immunoglobulin light chain junction region [Macaca mulatta]MOW15527.1 immunoglobulin light chain junction region [Macaca mulatta]MOW15555.1 immunoglobulin light chain junction region [Macaca mulatta]MOW17721.1 immunoglobulin light chain junction region [Macaca mulatta]MOW66219.1 immunoglobulin light chain junction region [Macaca mulatta]